MKKLAVFLGAISLMLSLTLPANAEERFQETDFSVEGIVLILEGNYGSTPCKNYDFRTVAERTYRYLKTEGKGATYAPINCYNLVVEFENNGSNVLDVHVKDVGK
jgi:hypothetical protein